MLRKFLIGNSIALVIVCLLVAGLEFTFSQIEPRTYSLGSGIFKHVTPDEANGPSNFGKNEIKNSMNDQPYFKNLFVEDPRGPIDYQRSGKLNEQDPQTGIYHHIPQRSIKETATVKGSGKVLYSVEYHIDSAGRRVVPFQPKQKANKHLIIVGCSFIFGDGLGDHETLPAQLQKILPRTKVYNMGVSGGSAAEAFEDFGRGRWVDIEPDSGAMIIMVSPEMHLKRFQPSFRGLAHWHPDGPYLIKDKNGKFEVKKSFIKSMPWLQSISGILHKSYILKWFQVDWPSVNDETYKNYVELLNQLSQKYKNRYGKNNQVYVYFHPAHRYVTPLKYYLDKTDIKYLDYSQTEPQDHLKTPAEIPGEGHPSADFNQLMARVLANDLPDL